MQRLQPLQYTLYWNGCLTVAITTVVVGPISSSSRSVELIKNYVFSLDHRKLLPYKKQTKLGTLPLIYFSSHH